MNIDATCQDQAKAITEEAKKLMNGTFTFESEVRGGVITLLTITHEQDLFSYDDQNTE